jgi:pyridoxine 5-phosphate synthase
LSRNPSRLSIHAQVSVRSPVESPILNAYPVGMARLSVNLNKIALLRNSRRTGVPDLRRFGRLALDAGARGLTVHPRPDERHIRGADVPMLAELMRPDRPVKEFNIEGYPDERFLQILRDTRPEQATLVPDAPDAFTSEEGWKLDAAQAALATTAIAAMQALGCRVILFIDPDPAVIDRVRTVGADGVELYTGSYAAAFRNGAGEPILSQIATTAARARAAGLVVNAGHDLNLHNIPPLMQAVPFLAEASIGHELTADALEQGWAPTVAAYARALCD